MASTVSSLTTSLECYEIVRLHLCPSGVELSELMSSAVDTGAKMGQIHALGLWSPLECA